jgi:endonuclease/exonuclease/phosphatase family metal-dependent hydrolase
LRLVQELDRDCANLGVVVLKVGSYNVEQFGKLAGKDKTEAERARDKAVRIQALRETLAELDVDVLSLQEVTSAEELAQVLDTKELREKFPNTAFLRTDNSPWQVNAAVVSKYPIARFEVQMEQDPVAAPESPQDRLGPGRVFGRSFSFTRGLGIVDVQVGDVPTRTYVYHGKADPWHGMAQEPGYQSKLLKAAAHRGHEMKAIERTVARNAAAFPSCVQIVTGDFNAAETSKEMTELMAGPLHDPLAGQNLVSHPATNKRMDFILLDEGGQAKANEGKIHDSPSARLASDHLPTVLTLQLPS